VVDAVPAARRVPVRLAHLALVPVVRLAQVTIQASRQLLVWAVPLPVHPALAQQELQQEQDGALVALRWTT